MARPALLHRPHRLEQIEAPADCQWTPGDTCAVDSNFHLRARKPSTLAGALGRVPVHRIFTRRHPGPGGVGRCGRAFFGEIVKPTGLLPSRVENALAELAASGWVTSDSFEGLRALLVPDDKKESFAPSRQRRHHRAVTNIEFAGRWSALRTPNRNAHPARDESLEIYARTLLRRYGVVFRRMLERESLGVSWFEVLRVYRRLEARGEIRGGYFVSGVSGEQFALPEAVGLLRSIRRSQARNGQESEFITISGADPLNLAGILTPGPRIAAITAHRILLRDGVPVAALKADQLISLESEASAPDQRLERALRVGTLSPALRPYYA